jgi:hypothetical protein
MGVAPLQFVLELGGSHCLQLVDQKAYQVIERSPVADSYKEYPTN